MAKARKEGKPQRNRRNLAKRAKILARNNELINHFKQQLDEA